MMTNTASLLFLVIVLNISAVLCSDSNDILQHLYDLDEEGSAQELIPFINKVPVEKLETEKESPNKVPRVEFKVTGEQDNGFEEVANTWNSGYKVPPAFHFAEVEKDLTKGYKVPSTFHFAEGKKDMTKGFKVPSTFHFAEVEKDLTKDYKVLPAFPFNKVGKDLTKGIILPVFSFEEVEKDLTKGYEVPPAFHFADKEKDLSRDDFKVLTIEELEKERNKVLEPSHDDELEILGLAVVSRIVLYLAIVLLVLGAIISTKFCCPHHHGKMKRVFIKTKDSDKCKVKLNKPQPV